MSNYLILRFRATQTGLECKGLIIQAVYHMDVKFISKNETEYFFFSFGENDESRLPAASV